MGFEKEAPGKVLVHWEDGSAIVRGDGTPEEESALRDLLRAGGCTDDAVDGISRSLLSRGLTMVEYAPDEGDPRVQGGDMFEAIADALASHN